MLLKPLNVIDLNKRTIRNKTVLVFVIALGCPCINQSRTLFKFVPYYTLTNSVYKPCHNKSLAKYCPHLQMQHHQTWSRYQYFNYYWK